MQNDVGRFCLPAKSFGHLALHQVVKAEPARYGKQYGQYGHNGQQGAVGQGGGLIGHPVLGKAGDAQVHRLDDVIHGVSGFGHFIFRDTPNVVSQEFPKVGYTLVHGKGKFLMKSSRPVSRVLFSAFPMEKPGACHLSEPHVTMSALAVYPPTGASNSHNVGLHDLATPKTHGSYVAIRPVGSYPAFSPLPHGVRRLFSSALLYPCGQLSVRKWDALCCPDFPLAPMTQATSRPTALCRQR